MVKSYIARHNEADRLTLKAINKGTSGNNVFTTDLGTQENMQAMGALERWVPWLAQETTVLGMRQGGEERGN